MSMKKRDETVRRELERIIFSVQNLSIYTRLQRDRRSGPQSNVEQVNRRLHNSRTQESRNAMECGQSVYGIIYF